MKRAAVVAAGVLAALLCVGIGSIFVSCVSKGRIKGARIATSVNLREIKRSIDLYLQYGDGKWPTRLEDLVAGKYMETIPPETITDSSRCTTVFDGKGGWFYDPKTGQVKVNLEGQDRGGKAYRDYGDDYPGLPF